MKNMIRLFLSCFIVLALSYSAQAQFDVREVNGEFIYSQADKMPMFPGCDQTDIEEKGKCADEAMLQYIYNEIKYPEQARKNGVEGMIVIKFVVRDNGKLSDIELLRKVESSIDTEALRVVEKMAKDVTWESGIIESMPVHVEFVLPIKFALERN